MRPNEGYLISRSVPKPVVWKSNSAYFTSYPISNGGVWDVRHIKPCRAPSGVETLLSVLGIPTLGVSLIALGFISRSLDKKILDEDEQRSTYD